MRDLSVIVCLLVFVLNINAALANTKDSVIKSSRIFAQMGYNEPTDLTDGDYDELKITEGETLYFLIRMTLDNPGKNSPCSITNEGDCQIIINITRKGEVEGEPIFSRLLQTEFNNYRFSFFTNRINDSGNYDFVFRVKKEEKIIFEYQFPYQVLSKQE